MSAAHTGRELLKLAAKAVGAKQTDYGDRTPDHWVYPNANRVWVLWNPRDDDGDSRRLAVKLNLIVGAYASYVSVGETYDKPKLAAAGAEFICWHYETGGNPDAAARLAVLRAAAAIGEAMP